MSDSPRLPTFSLKDPNNTGLPAPSQEDRFQRLEEAKQRKIDLLSNTKNMTSLDDSYTDFGEGLIESNRNKIWNELNAQDIQSVQAYGLNEYALTPDEEGNLRFASGDLYEGPTNRIYSFNTPEGEYKYGIARGDIDGAEARYTPDGSYGWAPGPKGVDVNQKNQDIILPKNVATILEGLAHGRREAFDARSVRDIYTDPDLKTPYGGGVSEYYTSQEGLFGAPQVINTTRGKELLEKYISEFRERFPQPLTAEEQSAQQLQQLYEIEADRATGMDRVSNTASAFASSLVNELLVRPAEAVGDLTGLYNISGTTDKVSEALGYNPVLEQRAIEEIGKDWDTIMSDDASTADKVRAAMRGMATAFTTPEMLGSSLGVIAAWTIPGGALGKLGVGSKYAAKIAQIDKLKEAGRLTNSAARLQKLKALRSVEGSADLLRKQSGHIVAAVGNVNEQYNEFVQNNNGVELEGVDKAQWFSNRLMVQLVNQNLDKLVAVDIIKSPGLVRSILPIAKSMTNKEFSAVAKQAAKGVLVSAKGVGEEAAQEYTQTMMELFNSRYGSEMFKDQDTFKEFLADERNLSEAGVAALAGAGGAGQFEVAGSVLPTVGTVSSAVVKGVGTGIAAARSRVTTEAEPETDESNAEVANVAQTNAQRTTTTTNPAAAYFSAYGAQNPEAQATASRIANQTKEELFSGKHAIFSSDAGIDEKIPHLSQLVTMVSAEDDTISVDDLTASLLEQLKPTPEQKAVLVKEIEQAYQVGKRFSSIKPMEVVAEEVSEGAIGFRTYYAQAYAALVEGDTQTYEKSIGQLDRFYNHQQTKLERVRAGVKEAEAKARAKANELVRQKKAANLKDAISQLRKEAVKKVDIADRAGREPDGTQIFHNDNRSGSTLIPDVDIYRKLEYPESYDAGIFRWLTQVEGEVDAMGKAYSSLIEGIQDDTPAPETTEETPASVSTEAVPSTEDLPEGDFTADEDLTVPPTITTEDIPTAPEENPDAFTEEPPEDFVGTEEFEELPPEDYSVPPEEEFVGTEDDTSGVPPKKKKKEHITADKDTAVTQYEANKKALLENSQKIAERRAELRTEHKGKVSKKILLADETLKQLHDEREQLKAEQDKFTHTTKASIMEMVKEFAEDQIQIMVRLYKHYVNGDVQEVRKPLEEIVDEFKATGFTLTSRTRGDVLPSTRKFADRLKEAHRSNVNMSNVDNIERNPFLALLVNPDGTINYNTVEAAQAAVYEFVMQEVSTLRPGYLTDEEIALVTGLTEDQVPPKLASQLREGGILLKLAASSVGETFLRNMGIVINSNKDREALATAFGMAALQGEVGTKKIPGSIINIKYTTTDKEREEKGINTTYFQFIAGTSKIFDNMEQIRDDIKTFEDKYAFEVSKERSYRTERVTNPKRVGVRRLPFQEAPKDHQDVVKRLENTAFGINSGHNVLMELFSKDGRVDIEALADHILGPKSIKRNYDAEDRYQAQRAALIRSLEAYQTALDDVGDGDLYFNWFIGRNHRIHLDSNQLNPQNDKHLARWLVTTKNSKKSLDKQTVRDVLAGKSDAMGGVMFAYGLVQAFDGVDGAPGIDKDPQEKILAYAAQLLEKPKDELLQMALEAQHLGHAALAISNIDNFNAISNAKTFSSDMVLEVDGLTNGFAFRSMQFPLQSGEPTFRPMDWLKKVGFIPTNKEYAGELAGINSMNEAKSRNQDDVYISVGTTFNQLVSVQREKMVNANMKGWLRLFEKHPKKGLPDFTKDDDVVKGFVRKLMKSPVMTFNYAAGVDKIVANLVNDQIMGTNYLSGRGLLDLLTEQDDQGNYTISEDDLKKTFKKDDVGEKYHKARVALATKSIKAKDDKNIQLLRQDLNKVIMKLYEDPLKGTLENLFSSQTAVNAALTNAAQFMFDYFQQTYNDWKNDPANKDATEQDKNEFFKDIAMLIPGVLAAGSDAQDNKITFLKSALEETSNDVLINTRGAGTFNANTVSRGFIDPGVRPAVLTILSLDSTVLARTINEAFKATPETGALPVHDAIVLGTGEAETINSYNLNFYTTNRKYSVMQEFVNAIEELEKRDGIHDNLVAIVGPESKKEQILFKDMKQQLLALNRQVQSARQELFRMDVKVGQLVGPVGTMAEIKVDEADINAVKYISKKANALSKMLDDKKLKQALGKSYTAIQADIENLIKGCK